MAENDAHHDPHISDHLANQRTFLSWIRTALGLIAFGFVIERFVLFSQQIQSTIVSASGDQLNDLHKVGDKGKISLFGVFLIASGMLLSLISFYSYKRQEKQIIKGTYAPSYFLECILTLILVGVGGFLIFSI